MKRVVLRMGCFWEAQRKLESLQGVLHTEAGYLPLEDGHEREVVCVEFDENILSLANLLGFFFASHTAAQGEQNGFPVPVCYQSIIGIEDEGDRMVIQAAVSTAQERMAAERTRA